LLEAVEQNRFFALFDRLVQSRFGSVGTSDLVRLGREAGLDSERLQEALAAQRHRPTIERLRRQESDGRAANHHPPELLVNGRRLSPWSGDEAVERAIAEARPHAEALLADGVPLTQLYERILELDEDVPFVVDPLARGSKRRVAIDLGNAPMRGPA